MDRARFDALARLLATTGSRRGALSALVGVALLGQHPEALADRQKPQPKRKSNARRRKHDRQQARDRASRRDGSADPSAGADRAAGESDGGQGAAGQDQDARGGSGSEGRQGDRKSSAAPGGAGGRDKSKGAGKKRHGKGNGHHRRHHGKPKPTPANCFNGGPCIPRPLANLQNCDFTGSNTLRNASCPGCNLRGASLRGADASGAIFTNANLSQVCLVDANLSEASINAGVNLHRAIFCRTTMPDGRVNNSGCANGTRCCPTCIAIGGVCGAGIGGSCCGGATCQNGRCTCPADTPIECNGECRQCCDDGDCSGGTPQCCNGVCRQCCGASDCPAQACQTAGCTAQGTCTYTPVRDNQPGPLCPAPLVCCDGGCCQSGQVCDTRGGRAVCCTPEPPATTCNPPGGPRCGTVRNNCGDAVDCGPCAERVCNTGACRDGSQTCEYTPVRDLTACDAHAAAGICCAGTCVNGACCTNANCTRGANTCTNHTCRCGSGPACTFPNTACCGASPGGTCVDTTNDRNNCGGCGQRCPSSNQVCTGDPPHCCQPPGTTCSYLFGLQKRCCSRNCKPFPFAPIGIGNCAA